MPRGVFWGTVAGFTSFVSHSGAPPFQMYVLPQKLEKLAFAGTATILFAIINLAKLVPYWELDSFSAIDPKLPLAALPVGILGTYVGAKLTRKRLTALRFPGAVVNDVARLVELHLRFHGYGGRNVLRYEDAPEPEPGPGDALIRVRACAVNHVDVDMRDGTS